MKTLRVHGTPIDIGATEGPPVIAGDPQITHAVKTASEDLVEVIRGFLARYGSTPQAAADLELARLLAKGRAAISRVQS